MFFICKIKLKLKIKNLFNQFYSCNENFEIFDTNSFLNGK